MGCAQVGNSRRAGINVVNSGRNIPGRLDVWEARRYSITAIKEHRDVNGVKFDKQPRRVEGRFPYFCIVDSQLTTTVRGVAVARSLRTFMRNRLPSLLTAY
jgi:hypothetical protein